VWPLRAKNTVAQETSKAIAYLKAVVPEEDPAPTIELPHDDGPVLKELTAELLVAYVVDVGQSFQYVQYRDLHTESISEAQLHEIGIRNLSTLAYAGKMRVSPYGNIFAVLLDGNFEASMILLNDLWDNSFRQFVIGDYLIAIPNRDILAFCDRSSPEGRKELMELVKRIENSTDHPLTRTLFVRRGNEWIPESAQ
jgi:uncharacterized protein YtpQ (UPF0354 family)